METTGGGMDPLFPPGFRFYPTEEELLSFYLRHLLAGTRPNVERFVPVVDIYSYHPRDLQSLAGAANVSDKEQWFFFCPRAERELHGGRPARTTPSGYWKATGSPSWVFSPSANRVIGEKRTMVFYQGRAPTGTKTRWKMNEYKAVIADPPPVGPVAPAPLSLRDIQLRNEFSVCRVYISTGTVRSFDRRPLNNHAGDHNQQLVLAPPAANTRDNQQQVAANGQTTETTHDSSSSGSRGMVIEGGTGDDAAAIDWDSLMLPPPADGGGLSFSADDLLGRPEAVVVSDHAAASPPQPSFLYTAAPPVPYVWGPWPPTAGYEHAAGSLPPCAWYYHVVEDPPSGGGRPAGAGTAEEDTDDDDPCSLTLAIDVDKRSAPIAIGRSRAAETGQKVVGVGTERGKVATAAEARKRRKEVTKLKHMHAAGRPGGQRW